MTPRAPVRCARALRRAATEAEKRLWAALRNRALGAKIRRQVPLGPFVADFACASARLVIELDGGQHAESARDARRDAWLAAEGWAVVRYWNSDVMTNLDGVLADILWRLQERRRALALTPSLSRKRERGRCVPAFANAPDGAQTPPLAPPLPAAGEGRGEGRRDRETTRSTPVSKQTARDVPPPLPLAGEGWGEGFDAAATPAAYPENHP